MQAQWPRAQPLEEIIVSGGHVWTGSCEVHLSAHHWKTPGPPRVSVPLRTPKQETTSTPSFLPFLKLSTQSPFTVLPAISPHSPKNPEAGSDSVSSHLCISHQSCPTCDLWTVAHEAPLSTDFPAGQEYWEAVELLRLHLCQPPLSTLSLETAVPTEAGASPWLAANRALFTCQRISVILQCSLSILCMAVPYACPFLPLAKLCFWD